MSFKIRKTSVFSSSAIWRLICAVVVLLPVMSGCGSPSPGVQSVSGAVYFCDTGIEDITISLTNQEVGTVTTETNGYGEFLFRDLWDGTYTIRPSREGYYFIPESLEVNVKGGQITDADFTAYVCWSRVFDRGGNEVATSVRKTSDCGFILCGYTNGGATYGSYDAWILKLDAYGNTVWEKRFGGLYSDRAYDVKETFNEEGLSTGFFISGSTESSGSGLVDAWSFHIDGDGNKKWDSVIGGTQIDEAQSGTQCFNSDSSRNGYLVSGSTNSTGTGLYDYLVVKIDDSGSEEWTLPYGEAGWDQASSVIQGSDHSYIICGYRGQYTDSLVSQRDIWIMKTDDTGCVIWQYTYSSGPATEDRAYSVTEAPDGGYVIAGCTSDMYGVDDVFILKVDENGIYDPDSGAGWMLVHGTERSEQVYSIAPTSEGGYIAAGSISNPVTLDTDLYIIKISCEGTVEWSRVFDCADFSDDVACSIEQTPEGGFIVAGSSCISEANNKMWVMKLDMDGQLRDSE